MSKKTLKDKRYESEIKERFDDIKQWIEDGYSDNIIARKLRISWDTIKYYLQTYPEFAKLFSKRPPKRPHKSDKYYTNVKPRFKEIKQWLKDRIPRGEINKRLGVGDTTMTRCRRTYPELNQLFVDAKNPPKPNETATIPDAPTVAEQPKIINPKLDDKILYRLKLAALGHASDVSETIEEERYSPDDKYLGKRVKTIERQVVFPPNVEAIKFLSEFQPATFAPDPPCACDKKEIMDMFKTLQDSHDISLEKIKILQLETNKNLAAKDAEIKTCLDRNSVLEQRVKELESIDDFANEISDGWSGDDDDF
jgi:hypothetical protein